MEKELDDGLCAFLCKDYCVAKKGYNPKNCPTKKKYRARMGKGGKE